MYHKRTFKEYIEFLEGRWSVYCENSFPTTKYGGGNPYSKCSACERSVPEISYEGHYKGCDWWRKYCLVQGLKRVLAKQEQNTGKIPD